MSPDPSLFGAKPTPRELVRAAQREQLLRAMLEATAERGFAGTTITEVVKAARVSTRTFYEQFADKEDCFLAAYDHGAAWVLARVEAALAGAPPDDWRALVRTGLEAYLATLASEPALARVLLVEVMGAGREAWRRRDATLASVIDLYRRFDATSPAGEAPRVPDEFVLAFVGAGDELARALVRDGRHAELPTLAERLARMLEAMLASVAASARTAREVM